MPEQVLAGHSDSLAARAPGKRITRAFGCVSLAQLVSPEAVTLVTRARLVKGQMPIHGGVRATRSSICAHSQELATTSTPLLTSVQDAPSPDSYEN